MLYNVLPPLIFFTSLGGIIVIVSRVVLRIQSNQRLQDIRRQSTQATAAKIEKTKQLARLIGPNQKSVQAVKSRLSSLQQVTGQTGSLLRRLAVLPGSIAQNLRRRTPTGAPAAALPPASRRRPLQGAIRLSRHLAQSAFRAGMNSAQALQNRRAARQSLDPLPQATQSANQPPAAAQQAKPAISISILNKPTAAPVSAKHKREHIARRPARRNLSAASAIEQAKQALSRQDYEAAERILVPYLAACPRDAAAYILLGKVAAAQGHWDEAAEIYEQVIKVNPGHTGSHAALGRARYELGQFTKAIEALRKAHDEEPENIAVIEYLLKIARRMDNVPMQRSLTEELAQLEQSI
ncbi:MAG: hypothetical protein COT71_01275 [Candidatus Andersenbacteria bacterium CG10_big_fil_rev_8_21_14_0_10_54_11]|uniref:Uncharacterized protein n=1 Tax=Candidatus Andersenbacteria bacterium CG10_big_fil_rev_8_21_14_0_10_54_11 TaxID=1974485 RepID=A0A2M6WZW4_9BACT|nr:MAG: hypothetical protein COT71_01275 [Candidatus Andersenbacteria bacterium CG10_big_fil_rev_8_21_14_0_10_54_11]